MTEGVLAAKTGGEVPLFVGVMMVTLGFMATSPVSQKARQISVMKKILEERSKMFSQDVCHGVDVVVDDDVWLDKATTCGDGGRGGESGCGREMGLIDVNAERMKLFVLSVVL